MKTSKTAAFARKVLTLLVALCMTCMLSVTAFAETSTNEAVRDDTSGVVQLKVIYTDPSGAASDIQDGTGFLINDSTVITCNHVVVLDPDTLAAAAEAFGCSTTDVQNRLSIQVSVLRDVTIKATVKNASTEMDYAILDLQSQLYDRTYLPIRSSSTVKQTEAAYALGFPGEVERFQDVNTYTSDDVTITSGQVNKLNTIGGVDYVQTSARITSGNSGCPLVDNNGAVIGICQGATGSDFDANYFYAIAIDQLTKTLDSLGISYTKADEAGATPATPAPTAESTTADSSALTEDAAEATPAPTADKSTLTALITEMQGSIEAKDYSEDTAAAFSTALEKAQTVADNTASTQEEVDAAVTALTDASANLKPANNIMKILPFIIIGAVFLLIIAIVLIVLLGKKKKPESYEGGFYDQQGAAPQPAPMNAMNGMGGMNNGGFAPVEPAAPAPSVYTAPVSAGAGETSVLSAGAGETSVLNAGAGETTVLGGNQSFGSLIRTKTGEKISLNNTNFIIGKERAKVNYCVSDNTSVSRAHVALRSHGGKTYIVDMKATNGTFVNSIRMNPGQETALNDGDKIMLADEEFTYHA